MTNENEVFIFVLSVYMELRDYQKEMKSRLYGRWRDGVRSILVQMPTGTGKTALMAEVIREQAEAGVLVVTHRVELVEQIAETLRRFGVQHGVIAGGKKRVSADRVQVASIQTLNRRAGLLEFVPGTVVVDEAHHAPAKTYRMLWEWWPAARFVGLTATPCRMGGEPLTDLFDEMLQSWSIGTFIEQGWLSDFEYVSADPNSEAVRRVSGLTKRGVDGDYQVKEMATVMDCPESIAHLYDSYKAFADGKKGIVYAINREHARHSEDAGGGASPHGGGLPQGRHRLDGQRGYIFRGVGCAGGGSDPAGASDAFAF